MSDHFEEKIEDEAQEFVFPNASDLSNSENEQRDEKAAKISELSIKGYQLLKINEISQAVDCFNQILELDDNNN